MTFKNIKYNVMICIDVFLELLSWPKMVNAIIRFAAFV